MIRPGGHEQLKPSWNFFLLSSSSADAQETQESFSLSQVLYEFALPLVKGKIASLEVVETYEVGIEHIPEVDIGLDMAAVVLGILPVVQAVVGCFQIRIFFPES